MTLIKSRLVFVRISRENVLLAELWSITIINVEMEECLRKWLNKKMLERSWRFAQSSFL